AATAVPAPAVPRDLAAPPRADSHVEDGVRAFDVGAQEGRSEFAGQDGSARTWGFDGDFLGPTLRADRGEEIAVDVDNALPEATSVHWHGMHLPAEMDGGPHQMI